MELFFSLLIILLLTAASGFCSSSEVALFSLSHHRIHSFQRSHEPRLKQIASLLHKPHDLLVTVFMINTLINILLQNAASRLIAEDGSWALKVGIPFLLLLLFGEIVPKYMGIRNNLATAYAVAPAVDYLQRILTPLRRLAVTITTPLSRLLFFYLHKERGIDREEISQALKMAQEEGIVEKEESEWTLGYLDLLETGVKELMVPREDVLFYDIQMPPSKLTHLFVEQHCSRIPVCNGGLDSVLGILSATQFFVYRQSIIDGSPVEPLLQRPLFIPEVTSARVLLARFYRQQEVIALAVDEYGCVSGLIALEDVAEVVIGPISDSRDHKTLYTRSSESEIIASGKLELEELNAIFSAELSSESMVTIGGWLTEQLDAIPQNGTTYEKGGLFFHVLTATKRRIQRLYIRKQKSQDHPLSQHHIKGE